MPKGETITHLGQIFSFILITVQRMRSEPWLVDYKCICFFNLNECKAKWLRRDLKFIWLDILLLTKNIMNGFKWSILRSSFLNASLNSMCLQTCPFVYFIFFLIINKKYFALCHKSPEELASSTWELQGNPIGSLDYMFKDPTFTCLHRQISTLLSHTP